MNVTSLSVTLPRVTSLKAAPKRSAHGLRSPRAARWRWWPIPGGGVRGRYGDIERQAADLGTLAEQMGPAVTAALKVRESLDINWRMVAAPEREPLPAATP